MKSLKYILFLLLIGIIGISIYVAVQPNSFEVTKTKSIKAPAAVIFEAIRDTSTIDRSSFWKKNEVLKSSSYNAPVSIQQSYTGSKIGNSDLMWQLKPNGDSTTNVTKSLSAKNLSFFFKAKTIFSGSIEKDIAAQLDRDLEKLESDVIQSMEVYSINVDGITEYGGGFYMYKTTSSTASNISNMKAQQFAEILNFMQDNALEMTGHPFTIYNEMNDDGSVIMSNAIPVQNKVTVGEESNILCGYMDRSKVLKTTLKGNYINLSEAWKKAMNHLNSNGLEASDVNPFEIYPNDPGAFPNPADWTTELYIPLKTEPVEIQQM